MRPYALLLRYRHPKRGRRRILSAVYALKIVLIFCYSTLRGVITPERRYTPLQSCLSNMSKIEGKTTASAAARTGCASPLPKVENNGFEPLTPCLQSRCSSQLS